MKIHSASFVGTNNDIVLAQTDQGEITIPLPPHAETVEGSQAVFAEWMANGAGVVTGWVTPTATVDPIALAQAWVANFFDAVQLLKMFQWVAGGKKSTKLGAVLNWEETITSQAVQGATTFANPPATFNEVAIEVLTQ